MTVIGLEATFEHKQAFTRVLQPLGWIALFLLISKYLRRLLQEQNSAPENTQR
jgi:flagellar biogenesis protein FliO